MKKTLMQKDQYKVMYEVEDILWWYKSLRNVIFSAIKRLPISPPKILDVGCGTGKTMEFLKSKGYAVSGFDLSAEAVSFCKKRGLSDVTVDDVRTTPFADGLFDIVLLSDVLGIFHHRDREKTILEAYRVLKKGGYLIVQASAFEFLRSSHDEVSRWVKRFTRRELEEYFPKNKWHKIKSSYRIFFLFLPVVFIKLMRKVTERAKKKPKGDLTLPPVLVNGFLCLLQCLEDALFRYLDFPFGTSLFLVVKKK